MNKNIKRKAFNLTLLFILNTLTFNTIFSQTNYWQQKINYQIDVSLNETNNLITGIEKITYYNQSPDTLYKLYFHIYWNAFQPNSSMDIKSLEAGKLLLYTNAKGQEVKDWDERVKDRIHNLKPDEIGYQKVQYVKINGVEQKLIEHETILEVKLNTPILPKSITNLDVAFKAQVPVQIRRAGRNNSEGIQYSMSQWYPKMVEYDIQGWHTNQYIAREFFGVWGNFTVNITANKKFIIAASGVLKNEDIKLNQYTPQMDANQSSNLIWRFSAENIHDFIWAADTSYKHMSVQAKPNLKFHYYYKKGDTKKDSSWQHLSWCMQKLLPIIEHRFGNYPYPVYSFIQGGDGGMEYGMATFIKSSSIGTAIHEFMHSWYQHILGNNESLYPFMDEGFANYADNILNAILIDSFIKDAPFITNNAKNNLIQERLKTKDLKPLLHQSSYNNVLKFMKSGYDEPLSTHADYYNTNYAYSTSSYLKGNILLTQLGYLIGEKMLAKTLLNYYNTWKFKHPTPTDFIRVAEKTSGLQLQWYKHFFIETNKKIDYAIEDIKIADSSENSGIIIVFKKIEKMPMPLDILITYKDSSRELHYIPLDLMLGNKENETSYTLLTHPAWRSTHPLYEMKINRKISEIKSIEIDPSYRMLDINRVNNILVIP